MLTCHDALAPLHDRLDGPLPSPIAADLASHLAECPACRALAADLDLLRDASARLPREVQPTRDLWPGIVARIAPAARWWHRPGWLAAAAIAIALGSSAVTAGWLHHTTPPPSVDWQADMTTANAELAAALEARRSELDPEALAVVERNLRIIDDAIAETAAALAERPDDPRLKQELVHANEQKLTLLRRALALARSG